MRGAGEPESERLKNVPQPQENSRHRSTGEPTPPGRFCGANAPQEERHRQIAPIPNRSARKQSVEISASAFLMTTNVVPQINAMNASVRSACQRAGVRLASNWASRIHQVCEARKATRASKGQALSPLRACLRLVGIEKTRQNQQDTSEPCLPTLRLIPLFSRVGATALSTRPDGNGREALTTAER